MVLEYDYSTVNTFSDGQLAGLAQHFKQEMDHDYNKRRPNDYSGIRKPAAVSVIATRRHLYVASFIKSNDYILHHGHESIQAALIQSQMENQYNSLY